MAFCSQCGTTLPDGARFCPSCGATIDAPSASSSPFVQSPEPPPPAMPHGAHADPVSGAPTGRRKGGGGLILPLMFVIALAVIGLMLLSQCDGAQSTADRNGEATEESATASTDDTPADATPAEDGGGTGDAPAATADEPATQSAERGDATTTTAASLDSAFNADPQGARNRYAGPLTVSGTIATMVTPGPTPALSLEGRTRFNFVVANLAAGSRDQLTRLSKGDRVTLSCSGVSALAGTTILQGCSL